MGEFKFELRKNKDNQIYFVFVSSNGRDICWSESYSSEANAIDAINLLKKHAPMAKIYRTYQI
jgi:uncharacterized protein YegP (UPF0339 family)